MRPLARWGTLPLLAAPMGTWALGLGEIELHSALNQPLDAEIALVSPTPDDLAGLNVSLAPPETFDRLGIERPAFMSSLQFEVRTNAEGESVIAVRSSQSITEPFVTMLVRATWPRGELMREYTVFLDPPVLLPEPPAPAAIQPAETRPPQQSVAGGAISRAPQPAPAPAPEPARAPAATTTRTPAPAPRSVSPAPAASPAQAQARTQGPEATADGTTYGPVQRGETLWGIATRYRPAGVSMNQMMLAVYQANPEAFGGNMNFLRRGAIVRVPPMSALQATSTANATAEVRRQEIEWQQRRANGAAPEARLVLVPPSEEPASVGGGAGADDGAEVSALRDEVAGLEQRLSESQRLLALRDAELADLQQRLSDQQSAAEAAAAAAAAETQTSSEPEADQVFVDESGEEILAEPPLGEAAETPEPVADEAPAEPAPAAAPTPAPAAAGGPSLVERILALVMSPFVLIGVGVAAVLIAALLFLRRRREEVEDVTGQWEALEAEIDEEEADHTATARLRAQASQDDDIVVVEGTEQEADEFSSTLAGAGADLGSVTAETDGLTEPDPAEQTMSSQTVINLDQADPIAEADFHMAYGLYDQAADLVGKALEADPGNRELELKLLEVYFVWGNKESFLQAATSLRQKMGDAPDADWGKVVIMGKQICPDEPLFADATAAAGEVDLDLEAGETQGLDIAFDEGDAEDVDLDFGTMAEDMELEVTGGRAFDAGAAASDDDLEITGRHDQVDLADEDMLDIGARTQAGLEAALFTTDDEGQETSPNVDVDSLDATQESPTIETPRVEDEDDVDWAGITMESPTVEQAGPESPTVESAALQSGEAPTVETPTIETEAAGETRELMAGGQDPTAELDLDDLGLDSEDIDGLPSGLGDLPTAEGAESDTREQPAIDVDDDLLSATGVTEVLRGEPDEETAEEEDIAHTSTAVLGDDEATMMAPSLDSTGISTEVLDQPAGLPDDDADADLDLNLDDLTMALKGGDTVEQPRASAFDTGLFDRGDGTTPVDLDIGVDVPGDDEPTGTEEVGPLDPQTMTEVGTKLDLARAYIDMGDPDGAKSILEEVLSEGDSTQKQEAQSLIDALPV